MGSRTKGKRNFQYRSTFVQNTDTSDVTLVDKLFDLVNQFTPGDGIFFSRQFLPPFSAYARPCTIIKAVPNLKVKQNLEYNTLVEYTLRYAKDGDKTKTFPFNQRHYI